MALRLKLPWRRPRGLPSSGTRVTLKSLRRWLGYAALGTVAFVAFVWLNLPTRALAWRISDEAKRRGYLITIGDLSVSPFGSVTLHDVTWNFTPSRPDEVNVPFIIDELEVGLSWISLLQGEYDVDVEATLDEGSFRGHVDWAEDAAVVELEIDRVPLYSMPRLQQSVNAPVAGVFSSHVQLTAPDRKFEHASGKINLVCAGCSIGDGEELVYIPGAKGWLSKGITLPEIRLGELNGELTVTDGVARAEEFQSESEDLTLSVGGEIQFNDPVQRSRFEIVIKLLVNERLQEQNDSVRLLLSTASKNSRLDPPLENWLGFRLRGSAARPRFTGINSKSREEKVREARERRRARDAERRQRQAQRQSKNNERDDADDRDEADEKESAPPPPSRGGPDEPPRQMPRSHEAEQNRADDERREEDERREREEQEQRERDEQEQREQEEREQEERERVAREEQEQAAREAEEAAERERQQEEEPRKDDEEQPQGEEAPEGDGEEEQGQQEEGEDSERPNDNEGDEGDDDKSGGERKKK